MKKIIRIINPQNVLWINHLYDDFVRMGVRLPYIGRLRTFVQVQIPKRDNKGELLLRTALIKRSDVHQGYLVYTQRTIITQAFKFLNFKAYIDKMDIASILKP